VGACFSSWCSGEVGNYCACYAVLGSLVEQMTSMCERISVFGPQVLAGSAKGQTQGSPCVFHRSGGSIQYISLLGTTYLQCPHQLAVEGVRSSEGKGEERECRVSGVHDVKRSREVALDKQVAVQDQIRTMIPLWPYKVPC